MGNLWTCKVDILKNLTLGSLFDGIGVFPLSASRHGIIPVWASEIEPSCIRITKRHFPDMKHLGSITEIDGSKIEPVDIITFGSPCQGLSLAGKRAGLADERSGLFIEAIRIIKEMRSVTNGKYPTYALWENVRGALSCSNGMDFKSALEAFADTEIPMPRSKRWTGSGMVRGGGCDIAWRCMDANHWGVPPRRRRIFLVADFGGQRAAQICFEPESLRGNLTQSGETGERFTKDIGKCAIGSDQNSVLAFGETGQGYWQHGIQTLRAEGENRPSRPSNVICVASGNTNAEIMENVCPTLVAAHEQPYILINPVRQGHIIRRLTPTECERLQGFPDGWTAFGADGKQISDSKRYAALGNSVALPCIDYLIDGIVKNNS